MQKKRILICGGTGFIGRNLLGFLSSDKTCHFSATYFKSKIPAEFTKQKNIQWIKVDLTQAREVAAVIRGADVVIQAAATTSGAKVIVTRPYEHVTDNAVMNSLIFRACHELHVKKVIFFSCTVMYPEMKRRVKEEDFNHEINEKYFGAGWTKVYLEKMCQFYARIGPTQYTVIRHSNIYGPHDKYDLQRSHVFGATVTKVMTAVPQGTIRVWGNGSEERDLLYVDDLVRFVALALKRQKTKFECVNVGLGQSISILELVRKIIKLSGRKLSIEFDPTKPSVGFKLKLNSAKAYKLYGWKPKYSLDQGIRKTLAWYKRQGLH